MTASVDIVIVNWNSGTLLRDCISSIARARSPRVRIERVVIVDNASTDGSARELDGDNLPLSTIFNTRNEGFGAACNRGARGSRSNYLLFMNPDTHLFQDTLADSLDYLQMPEYSNVGVCGVQLLDRSGVCARTCARVPTPARIVGQGIGLDRFLSRLCPPHFMREWDHSSTRPVDQIMGAYLTIRRRIFETIDGFDERFFLYYEDVDLCLRARLAGWQVSYFAGARALHYGGGSTSRVKDKRLFYSLRSRVLFIDKHYGLLAALFVFLAAVLFEIPLRIGRALISKRNADLASVLRGARMFVTSSPGLIQLLLSAGNREKGTRSYSIRSTRAKQ